MKIKFNDSNGIIKKILAITVSLVMVFNILPFFAEFNASALGEAFYDSSLGKYYEENGVLTAIPNENCGFRGWFNTSGEEVSLSINFALPQGKTKNDFYPVFYDFNILENGDFEEYTVGTDLKEKWHSTNSLDTFIVCENIAKSGENSLAWCEETKDVFYIDRLGVNSNYLRQGIGSNLLNQINTKEYSN